MTSYHSSLVGRWGVSKKTVHDPGLGCVQHDPILGGICNEGKNRSARCIASSASKFPIAETDLERKFADEWPMFSASMPHRHVSVRFECRSEVERSISWSTSSTITWFTSPTASRFDCFRRSKCRQEFCESCQIKYIASADVRAWELHVMGIEHANSTKLVRER